MMFTRLDPIIQAVQRKAEKSDAFMGMGRDETSLDSRQKKGGGPFKSAPEWEDTTEVSVMALRAFLQDLVGASVSETPPAAPPVITAPSSENAAAARAARAYQTTGRIVHDRNIEGPKTAPALSLSTPIESQFSTEETQLILTYITTLGHLENQGVETLRLQRSMTFLESIAAALTAAGAKTI